MLPDRVSNPGPLTYESVALPIALRGPAWGISHLKIKGCGVNACPPTLILARVLPTVDCSLDSLTKSNPEGTF